MIFEFQESWLTIRALRFVRAHFMEIYCRILRSFTTVNFIAIFGSVGTCRHFTHFFHVPGMTGDH